MNAYTKFTNNNKLAVLAGFARGVEKASFAFRSLRILDNFLHQRDLSGPFFF